MRRLNGADYVATETLYDVKGAVLAAAGGTCEKVPADSLSWLIRDGLVREGKTRGRKGTPQAALDDVQADAGNEGEAEQ